MSETNIGQASFGFESTPPPDAGWERPDGRTAAAPRGGRQSRRRDLADAPQGQARRFQREGSATPLVGTGLAWLTATEATSYLSFPTRKALYAAVERGQVPAHKLGRRLRFRREELDALLGRAR